MSRPPSESESEPDTTSAVVGVGDTDEGPADDSDPPEVRESETADAVDDAQRDAEPDAEAPSAEELRPRRVALLATLAAVVVVLDLITKIIAVALLTPYESPAILGGLVHFSLIRNPGAAFSMATGMTWILAVVASTVVVVIIRMAPKLRSTAWAAALGLILGGAIGNLIDRIFRSPGFFRGHVVDFVSLFGPNAEYFPVFNVADSAITIGGITLVITALRGIEFDGTRYVKQPKTSGGSDRG